MSNLETFTYNDKIVRKFAIATVLFGVIGMLAGLYAAFELIYPELNFFPQIAFGRLRPLHTNAAIFAFVGNGIFMGVYYSLQRLLKTRMWSDALSSFNFWGWQLIIVAAAITLPLGITSSKEYAELEWWIDIMIAIVWIAFGINMLMTIIKRRESHLYVAIWFYIATWVTVTVLHVFNNLEIPVSFTKSIPVFAGVQDALIQWWYGHNAVAFFLTTPYLGLMYYYLPKAAKRPVYSYKLSIIHFWALIFIYIWAGPHHLLYTSLPDWAQSLGTVFSIMLIAPSWGGMLNGLLTLRGAWDRVRTDPILKFMVVAVTAYGMSTLEGPLLSIKSINAISHYTDWTIGHVHVGTLGWNGMLTFGILYWLVPKLWNTKLHNMKWANVHFWLATLGTIFYAVPLYFAGWTQNSMWRKFDANGFLQYTNFLETVTQIIPMYVIRAIGGTIYFIGVILMVVNLYRTMKAGSPKEVEATAPARPKVIDKKGQYWHRWIEGRPVQMLIFSAILVLIGGAVEIFPMLLVNKNIPKIATVQPYTPLELEGRDIYLREGCYTCHSQMIRPLRYETERYGDFSKSGEFIYDRPFQWGSKRTGPDLAREGTTKLKKPNIWHYQHMYDPTSTSPGSIMPAYDFLHRRDLNTDYTVAKINVHKMLGAPYPDNYKDQALVDLKKQAKEIAKDLQSGDNGISDENLENREIIALIAYLQRLGTDAEAK